MPSPTEETMADDKTKRGSPDSKRLNKSEPYEMAYARKKAKAAGKRSGTAAKKTARPQRQGPRDRGAGGAQAPCGEDAGALRAPTAERREDDGEHRAADDEDGRRDRPPDRRPPAGLGAVQAVREAGEEEGAGGAAANARRRDLRDAEDAHHDRGRDLLPGGAQGQDRASLLDEADIEHASAKDLIGQIESATRRRSLRRRVKVLGEYITHHVVEEHTEMFPKCRRGGMDLVGLRERMAAARPSSRKARPIVRSTTRRWPLRPNPRVSSRA
jgi:hypothetical protein